MSHPHQDNGYGFNYDSHSFNYDMDNNTQGIHQVVLPHQVSGHSSFGVNSSSSASSSGTSHGAEVFVPMNLPRGKRNGSTVLFQVGAERNSLSIPLEECLQPGGSPRLKNPHEIMFPTLNRTQVPFLKLVIAWSGYDAVEYLINIGTNEAPITRADLARQIAYSFVGFFNLCNDGILPPRSLSWKVGGRDGYSFQQMHLSAFWNIEGNSWAASIRVLQQT
ncbi:uncharacterized protein EDB91DRAFT_786575 [Suillus paluster]|uniref:uncharacterized protein n=1 Tax=Suillus paluster TaxID=48578 RepID=UPI001B873486|nr:uncharacterized protein EDB91DRAFT_786575 [Suillus paluster]KAG1730413.1 hypothetical protein EDB91DRAFT_786575 [Suillus paluster]